MLALLSGLFWWQAATDTGGWVTAVAMPVVIVVGGFGMGKLLQTLKERFVYPRTGYVAYPRPSGRQRWQSGFLGLLFGVLFALLMTQFQLEDWAPALMGGGFGLFLFALGYRLALVRFQLLAIWSIGVGVALVFLEIAEPRASALILLLVAGALIISGAANLLRYLSHSQPPNDNPAEIV